MRGRGIKPIRNSQLLNFLKLINKNKCKPGHILNLDNNSLNDTEIEALAEGILSGRCSWGLTVILNNNKINIAGIKALAKSLESGQSPQKLSLNLLHNNIDGEGIKALAKAIASGGCSHGLVLKLGNNFGVVDPEGAEALIGSLESGKGPNGLTLYLSGNRINDAWVERLARALESGKCPRGLKLILNNNLITEAGAIALARALKSGKCPEGLHISLMDNNIGAAGIAALMDALGSKECPKGLTLDLFRTMPPGTELRTAVPMEALARSLTNGGCPENLTLNLKQTLISDDGFIALFQALRSVQCPKGLTLELGGNALGTSAPGMQALIELIKSPQCPKGLTLDLNFSDISAEDAKKIADALLRNTSVIIKLGTNSPQFEERQLHDLIKQYTLRNELIKKYPDYEEVIKKISADYHIYPPLDSAFPSLKTLVGSSMVLKEMGVNRAKLPVELNEYVERLNEIIWALAKSSRQPVYKANLYSYEKEARLYFENEKKPMPDHAKAEIDADIKNQDEINRGKLNNILQMLEKHGSALEEALGMNKVKNSFSKEAKKITKLIKECFNALGKNDGQLLTDESFSIFAKKIGEILETKKQTANGLFAKDTKDPLTVALYQNILEELGDEAAKRHSLGSMPKRP